MNKHKFECHIPCWSDSLWDHVVENDIDFWKKFEFEGKTYIRTFTCLVRVKRMTIDAYNRVKHNFQWNDPRVNKPVPITRQFDIASIGNNNG